MHTVLNRTAFFDTLAFVQKIPIAIVVISSVLLKVSGQ